MCVRVCGCVWVSRFGSSVRGRAANCLPVATTQSLPMIRTASFMDQCAAAAVVWVVFCIESTRLFAHMSAERARR